MFEIERFFGFFGKVYEIFSSDLPLEVEDKTMLINVVLGQHDITCSGDFYYQITVEYSESFRMRFDNRQVAIKQNLRYSFMRKFRPLE